MTSPSSSNPTSSDHDHSSDAKKRHVWLPIASLVLALVGVGGGVWSLQLIGDALGNPCERASAPDLTLPASLFWSSMAALGIATIMGFVVIGHKNWYPRDTVPRELAILGLVVGVLSVCGLLVYGALVMLGGNLCG